MAMGAKKSFAKESRDAEESCCGQKAEPPQDQRQEKH
jgi:hypothetical protein